MSKTTIQISEETKAELDKLKKGDMESYDAALRRIIRNHESDSPPLSESEVRAIVQDEIQAQSHR